MLNREDAGLNFLPKDEKFFEYFHQQSRIICQASSLLLSGLQGGYQGMCQVSKRIEAFELSGDDVTHKLFDRLRATFITPFDPEDIQSLAKTLDDVLDTIEDATFRIVAYKVDPIPPAAVELGEMIANSCRSLDKALQALEQKESVMEDCIEVNRLENQADAVQRTMVAELFTSNTDGITLIKLKDLYELLEGTTDRCVACAAAMGLGTLSGGWRVVHTMGMRLTRLRPRSGFCAETGAAVSILFATWLGLPVSTTHVVTGAIAGVGSIQRVRAVRWNVATNIVTAWILTIPAAALVAGLAFFVIRLFVPNA